LLEEAVDASDRGGDQLGGLLDQGFHILALFGLEWRVALCVGDVDGNGREVVPVFLGFQQGLPPVKAQSDPLYEAGHPIASDHLAMLILPD
jgi:hypothetical protein